MTKQEFMKYTGSLQQLAYVRPMQYMEGRAKGMRAYEVKCGNLSFHVMADKCLDISDFSYKGMNLTFLSKPGLTGRAHYDTNGEEARRSIMGGLFFTCGLENICAPCHIEGKDYPMHGRIRTTPAEYVSSDVYFEGDIYTLRISGEMREAELFGENMVLRRNIESKLGSNTIIVTDEIENQSFRPEPLMVMYHCNLGYPFLCENCEIVLPTKKVYGRDTFSEAHIEDWNRMDTPKPNEPEYVFIHELAQDREGKTAALVINHEQELAVAIKFNRRNLPYFMEWKSTAAGDYVLGMEPSNSSVYGKVDQIKKNEVHYLEPFSKETNQLFFTVLEGKEEIETYKKAILKIKEEMYETLGN